MFVSTRFSLTQHSISMILSRQPPRYIISSVWEFPQFFCQIHCSFENLWRRDAGGQFNVYIHTLPNLCNSNSLQGPSQVRTEYTFIQLYAYMYWGDHFKSELQHTCHVKHWFAACKEFRHFQIALVQ